MMRKLKLKIAKILKEKAIARDLQRPEPMDLPDDLKLKKIKKAIDGEKSRERKR